MNITALIAQHVIDVHEGDNWTEVNIANTLKDVTVHEAVTLTRASPNTIAALLHHISFWNRVMVKRTQGIAVAVNEANGYDVPALENEAAWQALKADNLRSAQELAAAIKAFDESKLMDPIMPHYSAAYKNLQGAVEHIHYHLGQVVILKKLIKAV